MRRKRCRRAVRLPRSCSPSYNGRIAESPVAILIAEHREIEAALDLLAGAVAAGRVDFDTVRHARDLCAAHYAREEEFLPRVHPAAAAKLRAQHDEVLEIAARLEESPAASEAIYLARRFLALSQHNMIEEERDVFPLAGR